MLTYQYTARDPSTGGQVKATVQADSESSAVRLIQDQGLVPIQISLSRDTTGFFGGKLNRIKSKDKVLFSRQLSTLINAGLPLVQSLRSVNAQTSNKAFKVIINQIITDVEAGSTLAAAMGRYPKVFNRVFISLIAAGEASGTLDKALERLAGQQEKDADIVSKVRGAMVYPLIVLVVMAAVMVFMLLKVLPHVKTLYEGISGAELPLVTRVLMSVSDFLLHYWWALVVALIILTVFTTKWATSIAGKRFFDKVKMRMWPLAPLFMKMYMARFARTGTTLIGTGVPLIQMLEITGGAVNNVYIEDSIKAAIEKVKAGKSLGDALEGDPNFLELVPNMLKIGEQSGSMEQMLGKAADYYEKELDNEIKAIQTTIEPVMMILMGVLAVIIVLAVLLPIYSLAGQADRVV